MSAGGAAADKAQKVFALLKLAARSLYMQPGQVKLAQAQQGLPKQPPASMFAYVSQICRKTGARRRKQ